MGLLCLFTIKGKAQYGYSELFNSVAKVPDFFQGWLDKASMINGKQDKRHFVEAGKDLYWHLDLLITAQQDLIKRLQTGGATYTYMEVSGLHKNVREFRESIRRHKQLVKQLDIDAEIFAADFAQTVTEESLQLDKITEAVNEERRGELTEEVTSYLKNMIRKLEDAEEKLSMFIIKLEQ